MIDCIDFEMLDSLWEEMENEEDVYSVISIKDARQICLDIYPLLVEAIKIYGGEWDLEIGNDLLGINYYDGKIEKTNDGNYIFWILFPDAWSSAYCSDDEYEDPVIRLNEKKESQHFDSLLKNKFVDHDKFIITGAQFEFETDGSYEIGEKFSDGSSEGNYNGIASLGLTLHPTR